MLSHEPGNFLSDYPQRQNVTQGRIKLGSTPEVTLQQCVLKNYLDSIVLFTDDSDTWQKIYALLLLGGG